MLRFHQLTDPKAALAYYSKSDSGEYYANGELRSEWLGKGAELLGLEGKPEFEHFKNLIYGLDPHTGDQLTAKLLENRTPGWDCTLSIPKGITIALERGDTRIQDALWEAARETLSDLEAYATTQVRKNGACEDRLTGNLIAFGVEHPETRPAKSDNMPDPDRHLHLVILNVTHDPVEDRWKAIKFQPIMELRKYLDRRFDLRLSSKLADLGYSIDTKLKPDPSGNKRYYSWDIRGMEDVAKKFSRRTAEVDKLAEELGAVTAMYKDKLGATSRNFKRTDLTLADYRKYWDSRVTPEEARQVSGVIMAALRGKNPKPTNTAAKGVEYAVAHEFERQSVMDWHDLAITAMERCMGGAKPEDFQPEAKRQGVLFKDGQVTTKQVLAEEAKVIAFAREGRGTCRPLGTDIGMMISEFRAGSKSQFPLPNGQKESDIRAPFLGQQKGRPEGRPLRTEFGGDGATLAPAWQAVFTDRQIPESGKKLEYGDGKFQLSPEQAALVNHVLTSADQVVLVVGDAGTGKTRSVREAFDRIRCPVEMLAPSSAASRGVLREEGFSKADTVASFLLSNERQHAVKGGVIWVDEAGLLAIKDLSRLTDIAKEQHARIVLQGDPKQHHSVVRHGNMMNVLQEYASLPVGRLTEIWRQKHHGYKAVVADIAQGRRDKAFDTLAGMGWVRKVDSNTPLVDEYLANREAGKSQLVVAPTHAEGDEITAAIRSRLKEAGELGKDHTVTQLVPLNWSEAQRDDLSQYSGDETLVFHRNSGTFKAGQKVRVADFKPGMHWKSPGHFSVYRSAELPIAPGDTIRITANGKAGTHKLNNGSVYQVTGFNKQGMVLNNGWTVPADYGHITHGYVSTSHASQGKTVDRVLIAMGSESRGAINGEQFYVSVSRGRESAKVYTDLAADDLKQAIQRTDLRKSATELMKPKPKPKRFSGLKRLLKKARERLKCLQLGFGGDTREQPRKEHHAGLER